MKKEEEKAIEILNTFELRRKTKNYKEISLEDSKSVKIVLNLIEKMRNCIIILDDELKERNKTINEKEIIIEKLQKENE